jgi:hypothetical protein
MAPSNKMALAQRGRDGCPQDHESSGQYQGQSVCRLRRHGRRPTLESAGAFEILVPVVPARVWARIPSHRATSCMLASRVRPRGPRSISPADWPSFRSAGCPTPTWRLGCPAQVQGRAGLSHSHDVLRSWYEMVLSGTNRKKSAFPTRSRRVASPEAPCTSSAPSFPSTFVPWLPQKNDSK